jgi:hypothetical protein
MNQENLKRGYIKLFRTLLDHDFAKERREFSKFEAWIDILFGVNHTPSSCIIGNSTFSCDRGQSLYSLDTWRARWYWQSKRKVRDFLFLLERKAMISYENLGKTIRITVLNYNSYQSSGGANFDNTERASVQFSSEARTVTRSEVVSKVERLNNSKSTTYKDSQNDNKTQAKREQNAKGTDTKREGTQVINLINLINETNENVCNDDTHKIKILESEIQEFRIQWNLLRNTVADLSSACKNSLERVNQLQQGHEANDMERGEYSAVLDLAMMNHNKDVQDYNVSLAKLNKMTELGKFKQKELDALKAGRQYALFSESVFSDKAFFVQSLYMRLQSANVKVSKQELDEIYYRVLSYSDSKQMKSSDWVSESFGWVIKDKVKLKKAV